MSDSNFTNLYFNGHSLNDYGLYVVSDGKRYTEFLFPQFQNVTSTVPGREGTIYWDTQVTNRLHTVRLATGGMTSRQYASFRQNFRPGTMGQLWFSETEYKYANAIVNEATTFDFLPFEGQVTFKGAIYPTTIYKGEATLVLFFPDPYFYGKYSLGDTYVDKDWFLESGLPLTEWLTATGKNILLANGVWSEGAPPPTTNSIQCYHAGNGRAKMSLNFKKIYPSTIPNGSFLDSIWNDYTIDDGLLTEPLFVKDIRYTYELLNVYEGTWAQNKSKVILDLQENLDSCVAGALRLMVIATGESLQYGNVAALKTEIRNLFFEEKIYLISINGALKQVRIKGTVPIADHPIVGNLAIEENCTGSFNNQYPVILPNSNNYVTETLSYQTIKLNQPLFFPEIYFRNTYE